jgi:hypothetical protein
VLLLAKNTGWSLADIKALSVVEFWGYVELLIEAGTTNGSK